MWSEVFREKIGYLGVYIAKFKDNSFKVTQYLQYIHLHKDKNSVSVHVSSLLAV